MRDLVGEVRDDVQVHVIPLELKPGSAVIRIGVAHGQPAEWRPSLRCQRLGPQSVYFS
jgi:hypothetical protein